jgi:hypothetical protein
MRLFKVIVIEFKGTKTGTSAKTGKDYRIHEFNCHETDFNGARIPVLATTRDDNIRDVLMNMKGNETMLPFSTVSSFQGKDSYNITDDVLKMSQPPK